MRIIFYAAVVCLLLVTSVSAQKAAEKKIYQKVEVENFTLKEGVEFPADRIGKLGEYLVKELLETKRFGTVSLVSGEKPAGDAVTGGDAATIGGAAQTLRIVAEIVRFDKGNRTMRYVFGVGGATKLYASVKFIDGQTGEVLREDFVDGDIKRGFFGGDSGDARGEVVSEIVKIAKKNFAAQKK